MSWLYVVVNDVKYSTSEMSLNSKLDQQYLKALEGFFLIIAKEGDIMYLSENTAKYLGLTQVRLYKSCSLSPMEQYTGVKIKPHFSTGLGDE